MVSEKDIGGTERALASRDVKQKQAYLLCFQSLSTQSISYYEGHRRNLTWQSIPRRLRATRGGNARMKKLTPDQRHPFARNATQKRWWKARGSPSAPLNASRVQDRKKGRILIKGKLFMCFADIHRTLT
jgi:hypothetical protein